ncbi:MAG: hypothetical protein M3O46_08745 [Myxococcota bacterium]|nr:hypothetical protein [Myxococcota bacterium]
MGGRRLVPFVALSIAFGTIPLVWPGDAPWINDEPIFIRMGLESNAIVKLAIEALKGHRFDELMHLVDTYVRRDAGHGGPHGVAYGPLIIWLYGAILRVVHDLVGLVVVHVIVMTTITALALGWIASLSRRLEAGAGAVALLSPYFWFYDRLLWDNNLLIPLSAISVAAYVAFSVSPKPWTLGVAAVGCTSMAMIHLMCAPLVLSIAAHAAHFHRPWLRRNWRAALVATAASLLIASPYIIRLAMDAGVTPPRLDASPSESVVDIPNEWSGYDWRGWAFPWLGGRVFSAYGLGYFFGDHWWISRAGRGGWVRVAGVVSCVAIGLVWIGLARVVATLWRSRRPHDADFHLGWICIVAFCIQCLLDGIGHLAQHPHYYNGIWICYFYFIWMALSEWPGGRVGLWCQTLATGGYAASLAVVIGFLAFSVHESGGNRGAHYGATLQNQIEVAKRLGDYAPDSPLRVNVRNYQLYPHALVELREFYGLWGTPTAPTRSLTIRYLRDEGSDGWLTLDVSP